MQREPDDKEAEVGGGQRRQPALALGAADGGAEVGLVGLAEEALAALGRVAGDDLVAWRRGAAKTLVSDRGCGHGKGKKASRLGGAPGLTLVTPSPTLSTMQPASWPRMQGNFPARKRGSGGGQRSGQRRTQATARRSRAGRPACKMGPSCTFGVLAVEGVDVRVAERVGDDLAQAGGARQG